MKEPFVDNVVRMLAIYIDNADSFDANPQLRVNPATLQATIVNGSDMMAELDNSDENVEAAAGAQGMESQDDTDYQASRNPDFYAVSTLISHSGGHAHPDLDAVRQIASQYAI